MTYEEDRTRQVRTGQALNLAIHMACNQLIGVDDEAAVLKRAAQLLGPVTQFIDQAQDAALADARKAAVVQAFPGAVIEPKAQDLIPQERRVPGGQVDPHPLGAFTTQTVTPTPVPGTGSDDW